MSQFSNSLAAGATKTAVEDAEQEKEVYLPYELLDLDQEFLRLCERKRVVAAQIKSAKAEEDLVNRAIEALLQPKGVTGCAIPGYTVRLQPGSNSHIDKVRLLEKGVKASIIKYATVVKEYVSVRLYPVKEG